MPTLSSEPTGPQPSAAPARITVAATATHEVEASYADLYVDIRGSSLFSARTALTKANEVAQLITDLKQVGIAETEIRLQGVRANVSGGRASSATYSLLIRCHRLESLTDVLSAVTSQKNTTLERVDWGYPEKEEQMLACLDTCARLARAKAIRIADNLGVHIAGIARVCEGMDSRERSPWENDRAEIASLCDSVSFGTNLRHTRLVSHTLTVDYYIAPALSA